MENPNKERYLIKILKELSSEYGLIMNTYCYNWLVELISKEIKFHILGYNWCINSSTAEGIAKDKSACYELLKSNNIAAIEHFLFLNAQSQTYIGGNGSWQKIIDLANHYDYKLVIKSNVGTGGSNVFLINTQTELEKAVQILFAKTRAISLCPFYHIINEYRVIVLDETPLLCYDKVKPFVVGDGKKTLLELIVNSKYDFDYKNFFDKKIDLNTIISYGEKVDLNWQHNLGKGAQPKIIDKGNIYTEIVSLAIRAAKVIGIRFAAVDVVQTKKGLLIMEINSGIMTENFARQGDKEYQIAKDIYRKALLKMCSL